MYPSAGQPAVHVSSFGLDLTSQNTYVLAVYMRAGSRGGEWQVNNKAAFVLYISHTSASDGVTLVRQGPLRPGEGSGR